MFVMADFSTLEKGLLNFVGILVAIPAAGGIAYTLSVGENTIKSAYQKIRGNEKSFKDIYNENWFGLTRNS